MRLITLLLATFLFIPVLRSQFFKCESPMSVSMSGAVTAVPEDTPWSSNPGGLGYQDERIVGIAYSNRFMIGALSSGNLAVLEPFQFGTMAGGYRYGGNKSYNENYITLAFGKTLFRCVCLGVRMNYYNRRTEAIRMNSSAISGEVGILINPIDAFYVGVHYANPYTCELNSVHGSGTISTVRSGISYNDDRFIMSAQLEWYNYSRLNLAFGMAYIPADGLSLRCGMKLPDTSSWSFGTRIRLSGMIIGAGFEMHQVLGISSSLSILIKIRRNGE